MKKYRQLTREQILEIRGVSDGTITVRRLAKMFGYNRPAIVRALKVPIVSRKTKQGARVVIPIS